MQNKENFFKGLGNSSWDLLKQRAASMSSTRGDDKPHRGVEDEISYLRMYATVYTYSSIRSDKMGLDK